MNINLTEAARIIPFTALMLGACVSQSAYEKQGAELQQAHTQAAAEQSQIAKMQHSTKSLRDSRLMRWSSAYPRGR